MTKYSNDMSYGAGGFTDNKCVFAPEDDAASANWGAGCRMPTDEELAELCAKCRWTWDTAHCGYLVTGPNATASSSRLRGGVLWTLSTDTAHTGTIGAPRLIRAKPISQRGLSSLRATTSLATAAHSASSVTQCDPWRTEGVA